MNKIIGGVGRSPVSDSRDQGTSSSPFTVFSYRRLFLQNDFPFPTPLGSVLLEAEELERTMSTQISNRKVLRETKCSLH